MSNKQKILPEESLNQEPEVFNITFRQIFEKFMLTSPFGRYFENFVTFLSFMGFAMFVFWTYYPEELQQWFYSDYAIGTIYVIEWLIKFYISQHRLQYLITDSAYIDIITAIPLFIGQPEYQIVSIARITRLLRVSRNINKMLHSRDESSEVKRQIFTIVLTVLTLIFISAGVMQVLEKHNEVLDEPYTFHDMIYFVIVTISTVGYGDISPVTNEGRACVIVLITLVLVLVPKQTNELISLMGMQSVYARDNYKSTDVHFIIVTGTVEVQALRNFCAELFHDDHGTADKHAVVLQQNEPTPEMEIFLRNPQYELNLKYLQGNAMQAHDLKRAAAMDSKAIILLTNKYTDDPYSADHKNILTGLQIKKYVYNQTGENLRLCMQLIKPESKLHYISSLSIPSNDQLIIVEEIKMSILAKSCFCPGLISMISNIVRSSGEAQDQNKESWMYEYKMGMGHEIYRIQLSNKFMGKTFSEAANIIYTECDAMMFSIELEIDDRTIIRLNPGKYVIPDTIDYSIFAYVICEDIAIAERITTWEMSAEEIAKYQVEQSREKTDKKNYEAQSSDSDKEDEEEAELDIRQDYYIVDEKDFNSLIEDDLYELCEIQNHIVVCGLHPSLYYFLLPLRARYLKQIQYIVILNPEPPDHDLAEQIMKFPKIVFIKGSPLFAEDLIRTNIEFADKAVIFRQEKDTSNVGEMLDAETVFIYKAISKVNRKIQIMVELVYSSTIEFLQQVEEDHGGYEFQPLFAAGEVYISSIIDTLTCQTYYNQHIVTILQQLLTSQEERSVSIREKCKDLDLEQSNLWQIQVPDDYVNHTFGELFYFLVSAYNVLPLGLYRFPGTKDNAKPYVYTNPIPSTRITHDDKIFLLAHTMPDQLLSGENVIETPSDHESEQPKSPVNEWEKSTLEDENWFRLERVNLHQAFQSQATASAIKQIQDHIKGLEEEVSTIRDKVINQETVYEEKIQNSLRKELANVQSH